ncbi:hypothetical protein YM3MPS_13410 [Mycobacterium pseudoshottsii]|nr:hypothetical protein YM3MPS_13410 [Mycobacterium pseudoshottsii]
MGPAATAGTSVLLRAVTLEMVVSAGPAGMPVCSVWAEPAGQAAAVGTASGCRAEPVAAAGPAVMVVCSTALVVRVAPVATVVARFPAVPGVMAGRVGPAGTPS